MPALAFLLPGDPDTRTGGYLYDRHMLSGLRALGWQVSLRQLPGTFPFPDSVALNAAEGVLAALPANALVVADGLALGVMPAQLEAEAGRLRLLGLIHHPLALETGLDQDTARRLYDSERRALAAVRRVLVTSRTTAAALADYGVEPARIGVVEPGTARRPQAHGAGSDTLSLLCVAAIVPRKGHDVLIDALHELRERSWRLTCVGSLERSPQTASALREKVTALGLEHRVELVGAVDEAQLGRHYMNADLFVLPTHYEGYGMALAEALAYGLPIVSTLAGAVPQTVPADAALFVLPADSAALARALEGVMDSPALRRRLASAARRAGIRLPSWDHAVGRFAGELERLPAQ